ncbi:hypothetical protein SLS55_008692 [Diplodia seriata]|uniref:Uncharacterized protein n=1 Tax=Diplodia seriata TaxID=420778 RepID=A0ABR3C9Z6_9PEZI
MVKKLLGTEDKTRRTAARQTHVPESKKRWPAAALDVEAQHHYDCDMRSSDNSPEFHRVSIRGVTPPPSSPRAKPKMVAHVQSYKVQRWRDEQRKRGPEAQKGFSG